LTNCWGISVCVGIVLQMKTIIIELSLLSLPRSSTVKHNLFDFLLSKIME
jgi:hypothetical protein